MALHLLEKIAPQNLQGGQQRSDSRKRTWSSSNHGESSAGGGGARGGGHHSASGARGGERQTAGSQQWKEGGRRDSFRSAHSGSSDGGGMYARRYSDGRSAREYGDGRRRRHWTRLPRPVSRRFRPRRKRQQPRRQILIPVLLCLCASVPLNMFHHVSQKFKLFLQIIKIIALCSRKYRRIRFIKQTIQNSLIPVGSEGPIVYFFKCVVYTI